MTHTPEDCSRIEALLPEFVEGSLAGGEAARVAAHVEACAGCREALAAFTALEASLALRRVEVPPVDAYLPRAFAPAAAVAPLRASRLVRAFRTVMSLPGVSILLVMWATMFAFAFRTHVANDVSSWSLFARWQALAISGFQALMNVTGGSEWALGAIYLGLTLVILASGSAVTLRFVRR